LETKLVNYYQIIKIYKRLIKKRTEQGKDSLRLKKRLLTIMVHGKDKSTHSV